MNTDSDADALPAFCALEQGSLHVDTAQHGLARIGEGDHESVTLILDHMAAMVADKLLGEPVEPLQHLHPSSVAQGLVVRGGILDIGEGDHDIAIGGEPGEIGTFDLRPACEIFDRVSECGADAFRHQ